MIEDVDPEEHMAMVAAQGAPDPEVHVRKVDLIDAFDLSILDVFCSDQ